MTNDFRSSVRAFFTRKNPSSKSSLKSFADLSRPPPFISKGFCHSLPIQMKNHFIRQVFDSIHKRKAGQDYARSPIMLINYEKTIPVLRWFGTTVTSHYNGCQRTIDFRVSAIGKISSDSLSSSSSSLFSSSFSSLPRCSIYMI